MIPPTRTVTIIPSLELSGMYLAGIAGCRGVVAEPVFGNGGSLIGYMVLLDKSFQGEHLWFVSEDAVSDEKDTE